MSAAEGRSAGEVGRSGEDDLTSAVSRYTASHLYSLETFASGISCEVVKQFEELQARIVQCLDMSDYFTDDIFEPSTQTLSGLVITGFQKTAVKALQTAVESMTTSMAQDNASHLRKIQMCEEENSARFGERSEILLNIQDVLETNREQANDLYGILEIRMAHIADVTSSILESTLQYFRSGNRLEMKRTAGELLRDFLKALKPRIKEEIGKHHDVLKSYVEKTFSKDTA